MKIKSKLRCECVKTPAFSYKGFDIPALDVPTNLINDLNTKEPAYKLAPKSSPLAWRAGLYTVGRDLAMDEADAESLPEPIRQAGSMVYKDCQAREGRGVWHKDGIVFEPEATIKGKVRPGEHYIAARYFINIEGFDKETHEIKTLSSTREERIWVPRGDGNFIVPTKYGAYDPITGMPFETIIDRNEAIKRWTKANLTEKQAKKEISRFYRGSSGTYAVSSGSNDSNGPLCVFVDFKPINVGSTIGSLAISRSAEQSEAPQE